MAIHEDLIDLTSKFSDQKLVTIHGDDQTDTSYLPPEIIQQILPRLPLKCLLRFRILSKSWNTMIAEFKFFKVHTKKSYYSSNCFIWKSHVSALSLSTPELSRDYPDITVDHSDWKVMLPVGKREVFWESCSMGFSIEPKTGKNCFIVGVGSTRFEMCWGLQSEHIWRKISESRLQKLCKNSDLSFRGVLGIEMLSPNTFYAAYLVFKFNEKIEPLGIMGHIAFSRGDGWMEMDMGEVYVDKGECVNRDIEAVVLIQTKGYDMTGLVVKGIEFRPSMTQNNSCC